MGAQEVQPERVVDARHLARRWLRVDAQLAASSGGFGAGEVDERVPGHRDQPSLRITGRVVRPGRQRLDDRLLDGVLGRREIGAATDEDVQDLGCQRTQKGCIDVSCIAHVDPPHSVTVGAYSRNGRTSSHSWIGFAARTRCGREFAGELDRSFLAVDVDDHPARDQILRLGERAVGHRWLTAAVGTDPHPVRGQRLTVDVLAGSLEPGGEIVHELDVRVDLVRCPLVHRHVVDGVRGASVVLEEQVLRHG